MNRVISMLALALLIPALPVQSDTHYVWGSNPSPSNPFTNWSMAATNLQDAVNVSSNGDTVLVTNGTYVLTNQISISKGITMQSVNGASSTMVSGSYPAATNRCFYLTHADAVVDGFTITNGFISGNYGGGVYMTAGMLQNCVISSNTVSNVGGGVEIQGDGMILNCTINGNSANNGGGIWISSANGMVRNCLISSNAGLYNAYGVYFSGGGTVQNCTIVSNTGGIWNLTNGVVQNSIIYFNTVKNYTNQTPGSYSNSCFTPALTGESTNRSANNITNDPRLVNFDAGNFRLSSNSPCRNAGTNQNWMIPPGSGTVDLDGLPRIRDVIVDMGAYEYIPRGTIIGVKGQ